MKDLSGIKMLAMDVDGVLTDGSMVYTSDGITKIFHVHDGLGLRLAVSAGLKVVWITGNVTSVVAQRAADLQITAIFQNARYKDTAMRAVAEQHGVGLDEIAYIGDDLNDLPAFRLAGVTFAPVNAVHEIKLAADYVTERAGGFGAVREMVEQVLKAQGRWEEAISSFLEVLKDEQAKGETAGVVA